MYEYLDEFLKKYEIIHFEYEEFTEDELKLINYIIKKDKILDTNNSNILYFISLYYLYKLNNKIKFKEYSLKAINMNNSNAMVRYAYSFKEEEKIYYLKAIELNNSNAMNGYAYLLENENKIEEAIYYYLKAIELNNKAALHNYLLINSSKLKKYLELKNIKSDITEKELIELNKDKDVLIFNNKLKKYSEKKVCELCYENKINILLNCFNDMVCTDCYKEIYDKKCPFCRL